MKKVKGKVVDVLQVIEVVCPYCGELNIVQPTGDCADDFVTETCKHYLADDYENNEAIFSKKELT